MTGNRSKLVTAHSIGAIEANLRAFVKAPLYLAAGPLDQQASAFEAERKLVARAIPKRKTEFFSGRYLARQALKRAGFPPAPLLRGELGSPIWPPSAVGSISHDHQYGFAAIALARDVSGLGVDLLEAPEQVDLAIASHILYPDESTLLKDCYPELPAVAVAFSVKEAVVKTVSATVGRYMDFKEIRLQDSAEGLIALVEGLPYRLPCLVMQTPLGLLSCCYRAL